MANTTVAAEEPDCATKTCDVLNILRSDHEPPAQLDPDGAQKLIQEYYKLKRGYLSAAVFLVMYLTMVAFLENFMHVEVRSAQGVSLAKILPASTIVTYSETAFWTSIVTGSLIGTPTNQEIVNNTYDFYDPTGQTTYSGISSSQIKTCLLSCAEFGEASANSESQSCISDCVTNLVPVSTVTNYDPALGYNPFNQTLAPVKAQKSLFGEEWARTIYNVTNASGTYASVDTHGYNHNAGHVIGGVRLTVQNKKEKDCTFVGVGRQSAGLGQCSELTAQDEDLQTATLVLENGLSIPYDDQHDGYSVFLSTALPRENLTSIIAALQGGGFANYSRYKLTYATHLFFPMGSTLITISAEFRDQGAGVYAPTPVYPSKGAKLQIYNSIESTFKEHGMGTFAFLVSIVLWAIHILMFFRELFFHRGEFLSKANFATGGWLDCIGSSTSSTDRLDGGWLDFLFHQPHSFSAGPKKEKKDKDKKKGDKENGAGGEGNNDVEDKLAQKTKHRQTILKAWGEALEEDEQAIKNAGDNQVLCTQKDSDKQKWNQMRKPDDPAPFLGCKRDPKIARKLDYVLVTIFHLSYLVFVISMAIISTDQKSLRNTFEDEDWLLSLKEARMLEGEVVTQEHLDGLWQDYEQNIHSQLGWILNSSHKRSQETLDYAIFMALVFGALRFLEHLAFQQLLSTLTRALKSVAKRLIHAFMILFVILIGFALIGHFVMAMQIPQFFYLDESLVYMFNIAWSVEKINIQAVAGAGTIGIVYNLAIKVIIVAIVLRMVLAILIASYKDIQRKDNSEVRGVDGDLVMMAYMIPSDNISLTIRRWSEQVCPIPLNPAISPLNVHRLLENYMKLTKLASDEELFESWQARRASGLAPAAHQENAYKRAEVAMENAMSAEELGIRTEAGKKKFKEIYMSMMPARTDAGGLTEPDERDVRVALDEIKAANEKLSNVEAKIDHAGCFARLCKSDEKLEQELEDAKKELKKTKKKIREQNLFEHLRNSDKSKSMTKAEKLCQKRCAANHAFKEADKAFKKKRDPKGDESYEQWDMKDADITDEMVAWEETAEKKRKCQHRHDRYELRASVIALIKISCLTDRCGHFERDIKGIEQWIKQDLKGKDAKAHADAFKDKDEDKDDGSSDEHEDEHEGLHLERFDSMGATGSLKELRNLLDKQLVRDKSCRKTADWFLNKYSSEAVAMYFWGSFDVIFASKKAISQARSQNKNVTVAANPLSAPVGSSSKGNGVTTI